MNSKKNLSTRPMRPPLDAKNQFIDVGVPLKEEQPAGVAPAQMEALSPKREERVNVYLTKDEMKRLRRYALEHEVKLTNVFREAAMRLVEQYETDAGERSV
jgi:hypothetical protein